MTDQDAAAELRSAAQLLLDLADGTDQDIATNPYWKSESHPQHQFANGIDNAVGGPRRPALVRRREGRRVMAAWTPPPPGDRREQLPDHLLALIDAPPYLSTACEVAGLLDRVIDQHQDRGDGIDAWVERMHGRCRLQNKFTGTACRCECHDEEPT